MLGVSGLQRSHEVAQAQLAVGPEREQLAARGVGELELERPLAPLRGRATALTHDCAEAEVLLAVVVGAELGERGLELVEPVVGNRAGAAHVLLDAGREVLHRLVDLVRKGQQRAD